jgi:hypothetical protein
VFIDTKTLPATGTYSIVVDPTTTNTGTMTLTLYNVPPDISTTITAGGSAVPLAFGTPGQNATVTFSGTAGQRVSLEIASTVKQTRVSIVNPDSSALIPSMLVSTAGGFVDTKSLPATGTYTITVDPQIADTGTVTLSLYNVPANVSGTITPGGAAVPVTIGTPGQNAALTFSGTTNQRISLWIANDTIGGVTSAGAKLSILKPDATALINQVGITAAQAFIDTHTLPLTGTYTIVIDPVAGNTGSMNLTLYNVPADISGTITKGGASVTVTTTIPGQNGALTFSGTSGTSVTLKISDAIGGTKVSLVRPDSTVQVTKTGSATTTVTLTATGTYTINVDPQAQKTGSVTLTLT